LSENSIFLSIRKESRITQILDKIQTCHKKNGDNNEVVFPLFEKEYGNYP
jgi:hypothetical protein